MTEQAIIEDDDNQVAENEEQEIDLDLDSEIINAEMPEIQLEEGEDEKQEEGEVQEGEEEESEAFVSNPVRQLRTANRELAKKLKLEQQEKEALKRQIESKAAVEIPELPKKPELGDDGIDYDPELFEKALTAWHETKIEIDKKKSEKTQAETAQQEKYNQKLQTFEQNKVNYKGFEDSQKLVEGALNLNQQGILVYYSEDPNLVVHALAKNPIILSQLQSITDPIEYALKVKDIEQKAKAKMGEQRKAPPPEGKLKAPGAPKGSSNHEKELQRLRDKGDSQAVIQYKRKHNLPKTM